MKSLNERVNITFSCPLQLKKQAEKIIAKNNYLNTEKKRKETLSFFCCSALELYVKAQNVRNYEDFEEVFNAIFVNNYNVSMSIKYEILLELKKTVETYIKEFDDYFKFKEQFKDEIEDLDLAEKIEERGMMAAWIVNLKMQKRREGKEKKEKNESN